MFRVLKPGGKVFLTTHMAFEEHMLPHDYWRFTEFGIKLLGERAKFKAVHFQKAWSHNEPYALCFLDLANKNFF